MGGGGGRKGSVACFLDTPLIQDPHILSGHIVYDFGKNIIEVKINP